MKPRTVILTLELQDCDAPLDLLRRVDDVEMHTSTGRFLTVRVAQATASVAQPSTTRGGKGRRP